MDISRHIRPTPPAFGHVLRTEANHVSREPRRYLPRCRLVREEGKAVRSRGKERTGVEQGVGFAIEESHVMAEAPVGWIAIDSDLATLDEAESWLRSLEDCVPIIS